MLGGPYPWGRRIEEQAHIGATLPYNEAYHFKRVMLEKGSLDCSFSGMKSQAHTKITHHEWAITETNICQLAYEFQDAMTDILSDKIILASQQYNTASIAVVWWVSANTPLRTKIQSKAWTKTVYTPTKMSYCMDNAAMIGVVGLMKK